MATHPQPVAELDGKKCLITGASRGIGRSIAEELAAAGADVVVNYWSSEERAHDVAAEIESAGQEALVARADVSSFEDVEEMAERVHGTVGDIDVLVNNAGINIDRQFGDLTLEDWQRVIDINLTGAYNTTEVFFDDVRTADHGRVVNISSVIGEMGNIGQANYAASKSGLFGLTRTLARELAGTGATVNAVAPGFTKTDMLSEVPEDIREQIRAEIPVDRFAEPEEVAGTVSRANERPTSRDRSSMSTAACTSDTVCRKSVGVSPASLWSGAVPGPLVTRLPRFWSVRCQVTTNSRS